jgi:hypothetical protein
MQARIWVAMLKLIVSVWIFWFASSVSWADTITDSLVKVSSEYYNVDSSGKAVPSRLQGAGLIFRLKDSERTFVLTASHLSGGSIDQSLIVKAENGVALKIVRRESDNLRDLEVIEVDGKKLPNLAFTYEVIDKLGMTDKLCIPSITIDESLHTVYSQYEKTRVFIPSPNWIKPPLNRIKFFDFYDRYSLASPRITYDGLYTKEFLSETRLNSVFRLDESVIDNPVRAGMSGLPIMAEVSERWDDTSPRIEICAISLVQAYHRILPRSYGASINQLQVLIRRIIEKEHIEDRVEWAMQDGLTYRRDKDLDFKEAVFGATEKNSATSAMLNAGSFNQKDGGSGASVDGGSGASVDGGTSLLAHSTIGVLPGLYDEQHVLAYQFEDQYLYADLSAFLFSKENLSHTRFTPLKYPVATHELFTIFEKRIEKANKGGRALTYRSQQLIKWTLQDFEANSYFSQKAVDEERGALTRWPSRENGSSLHSLLDEYAQQPWPEACVIDATGLNENSITLRLINSKLQKTAQDFIYFKVNLKGQLLAYYDVLNKVWVKTASLGQEYFPFVLPLDAGGEPLYVETKGLLFMDMHDAFKHINRAPEYNLSHLRLMIKRLTSFGELVDTYQKAALFLSPENGYQFYSLERNIKLLTAFVEHLGEADEPFLERQPEVDAVTVSPLGESLSRMSHIVVTPIKTGMAWPLICTAKNIPVPN